MNAYHLQLSLKVLRLYVFIVLAIHMFTAMSMLSTAFASRLQMEIHTRVFNIGTLERIVLDASCNSERILDSRMFGGIFYLPDVPRNRLSLLTTRGQSNAV